MMLKLRTQFIPVGISWPDCVLFLVSIGKYTQ